MNGRALSQSVDDRQVYLAFAAASLSVFAVYFFLISSKPILDAHAFRQTQTAISAYWLVQEGIRLDYITPVLGYPWKIPFEFPTYQIIVAQLALLTGSDLDVVGRSVSFFFTLLCVLPAGWLLSTLSGERDAGFLLAALFFSTPHYIFWGSSFLIESTALFFTLACLAAGTQFARSPRAYRYLMIFCVTSIVAALTKVTTYAPALLIFLFLVVADAWLRPLFRSGVSTIDRSTALMLIAVGVISVLIAKLWIAHTDTLKAMNDLGVALTSEHLAAWNFGTFAQRGPEYLFFVLRRVFTLNVGLLFGSTFVVLGLIRWRSRLAHIILVLLLAFFMPILIFTNLHIVHDYYQTANLIYIVAAVTLGLIAAPLSRRMRNICIAVVLLANIGSGLAGQQGYMHVALSPPSGFVQRTLDLAKFIRQSTEPSSELILIGYDWSAEVHYYAQRKGVAVPNWVLPQLFGNQFEKTMDSVLIGVTQPVIAICPDWSMGLDAAGIARGIGLIGPYATVDDCRVYRPAGMSLAPTNQE